MIGGDGMGKKLEKRSIPANILIYLILILLAVSYLYPLYFMGVNSLKSQAEYMKDMFSVDLLKGHFENYLIIFKNFKIILKCPCCVTTPKKNCSLSKKKSRVCKFYFTRHLKI